QLAPPGPSFRARHVFDIFLRGRPRHLHAPLVHSPESEEPKTVGRAASTAGGEPLEAQAPPQRTPPQSEQSANVRPWGGPSRVLNPPRRPFHAASQVAVDRRRRYSGACSNLRRGAREEVHHEH